MPGLLNRTTFRQLLSFGVVGGVQYVVDIGVFSGLFLWSDWPIISNLVSRALGATCGYYLNGFFTFRVLGRGRRMVGVRFVLAWLMMTAVSTALVKSISLLSQVSDRPGTLMVAKAAIEIVLFFVGFLLCKLWVFTIPPHGDTKHDSEIPVSGQIEIPADSPVTAGRGILFILAHPDDEYFFSPRIRQAILDNHNVYCAFTTDGAGHGVPPETRVRESTRALKYLGVPEHCLFFTGIEAGIKDRSSYQHLDDLYEALLRSVSNIPIDDVYVLAWEGGHVDHDASHLVGVALAKAMGVPHVYECPAYNGYRTASKLFRVMRWIPRTEVISEYRFGIAEGLAYFLLFRFYRSQWKTFLGLAPESFVEYLLYRRHGRRLVNGIEYAVPPHSGPLLYERLFNVSYNQFHNATVAFIAKRVLPPDSRTLTSQCG